MLARLERGECEGLLPDFWLESDDLLHFALDLGAFDVFATLPDPRKRRTIPAALFGKVLLAGTLPDGPSLRQMGATVFHSAVLLDQLGVNFTATRAGGARTGDERPFDMEALGDYFAGYSGPVYRPCPDVGALAADPGGTARADLGHRLCRCGLPRSRAAGDGRCDAPSENRRPVGAHPSGALPLLWQFGTPQDGDITLAKPLWEAAVRMWGTGACRELLVDAGFLDGEWLATLHRQGTTVITRVREGMDPFTAAVAYVTAHPEPWQECAIPRRPAGTVRPVRRGSRG